MGYAIFKPLSNHNTLFLQAGIEMIQKMMIMTMSLLYVSYAVTAHRGQKDREKQEAAMRAYAEYVREQNKAEKEREDAWQRAPKKAQALDSDLEDEAEQDKEQAARHRAVAKHTAEDVAAAVASLANPQSKGEKEKHGKEGKHKKMEQEKTAQASGRVPSLQSLVLHEHGKVLAQQLYDMFMKSKDDFPATIERMSSFLPLEDKTINKGVAEHIMSLAFDTIVGIIKDRPWHTFEFDNIRFNPPGTHCACVASDGVLHLFDITADVPRAVKFDGRCLINCREHFAFSEDSLVWVGHDKNIHRYNIITGNVEIIPLGRPGFYDIAIKNNILMEYCSIPPRTFLRLFDLHATPARPILLPVELQTNIRACTLAGQGDRLVVTKTNNNDFLTSTSLIYDIARGSLQEIVDKRHLEKSGFEFNKQGTFLAYYSDNTVSIYNILTQEIRYNVGEPRLNIYNFNPQSTLLALVTTEYVLKFYDLTTSQIVTFPVTMPVRSFNFFPDGKVLAYNQGHAIYLYNFMTQRSTYIGNDCISSWGSFSINDQGDLLSYGANTLLTTKVFALPFGLSVEQLFVLLQIDKIKHMRDSRQQLHHLTQLQPMLETFKPQLQAVLRRIVKELTDEAAASKPFDDLDEFFMAEEKDKSATQKALKSVVRSPDQIAEEAVTTVAQQAQKRSQDEKEKKDKRGR